MPKLVEMREQIAKFIGAAKTDEVVLVPNASVGLNTILRNIEWEKGDAILVSTYSNPIFVPEFHLLGVQRTQHTTLFIAPPSISRTYPRTPLSPF